MFVRDKTLRELDVAKYLKKFPIDILVINVIMHQVAVAYMNIAYPAACIQPM